MAVASASRCKSLHMTALRLIYLSPTFWRNYMAIREMGNNFRHDAPSIRKASLRCYKSWKSYECQMLINFDSIVKEMSHFQR